MRIFLIYGLLPLAQAFTIPAPVFPANNPQLSIPSVKTLLRATIDTEEGLPELDSMRVKELKGELEERNVSYTDCFDKESLSKRLQEARDGTVKPEATKTVDDVKEEPQSSPAEENPPTSTAPKKEFNKEEKLAELRAMKVRQLREECAKRKIRWAQFIEKEDLVQALIQAIENSADFSVSGAMQPGQVTELTGDQLDLELSQPSNAPLLLDIFATWCGPCQMMAPQLEQAAADLGDRVRVGKIDSDKYPVQAQRLKAAGLPTVLVLNGSEELERIEGALMKDQILQFVDPYL